jgi:hypothetical protein
MSFISWNCPAGDKGSCTPFSVGSWRQHALTVGHHSMCGSNGHTTKERRTLVSLTPCIMETWVRWFTFLVAQPRWMNQHG